MRLLVVNSIQKQALLFELLDDERIRLKDITSLKLRYFVCEAAPVVHRGEHLQLFIAGKNIRLAVVKQSQLIVLLTMSRSNVHATRALIQSDKIAQ